MSAPTTNGAFGRPSDRVATNGRPGVLRPLAVVGTRVTVSALRPVTGALEAAMGAGMSLERRAVDRVLSSREIERVVVAAVDSAALQAAFERAVDSSSAKRLVDALFESGLVDRFIERLAASDALWRLIDEIAQSPAVTAAISDQSLGFADQFGEEVRRRSRKGDDWLERTARRLARRRPAPLADASGSTSS